MLSPEQMQAFSDKISAAGSGQGAERTETTETTEQTTTTETTVEATKTEEERAAQEAERAKKEQPTTRGPVPYDRFQEVTHKRREAEQRAERLEKELAELRKGNGRSQGAAKSFLDELAEQERGSEDPPQNALEQRLATLEGELVRKEAATLLDQSIAKARAAYPGVPDRYFYAAIGEGREIEDGVELWEQTKREVMGQTQAPARQESARPGRVATPPLPPKAPPVGPRPPATMEEAHAAFRKRMMQG